ncbi:MAG: hypothetical protein Q3979_02220 [Actinomycetaceae bacterium]|nr:hypothetical protein [Actinomycetaceae bacterium]
MAFAIAQGQSVLLVDADTRRPCLAQLLGAERETSALIAVARRLSRGDSADVLRECAVTMGGVDFLAGLNSGLRWREVPSAAMEEMWRRIRLGWDVAVVDCAPECESQGDVLERDAVTRSLLVNADIVLCVGRASPVGVRRLLGSLDEAALSIGVRPVPVIVRGGTAKSSDVREISGILAAKDVGAPLWLREDPSGYAKAEREGVPLREASPSSPAVRDVLAVARGLGIAAAGVAKRRGRLRRGRRR